MGHTTRHPPGFPRSDGVRWASLLSLASGRVSSWLTGSCDLGCSGRKPNRLKPDAYANWSTHAAVNRQHPTVVLESAAQEQITLARRIERGDLNAKERMIESNLRSVHAVAKPYYGSAVPFDDLVQEGTVGLVRAVERFDHRRGLKFSTYAVWWIRRAMLDAIAGANAIRIPAKANHQLAAMRRAEAELERRNRRRASTPRSRNAPS
jgi:DNA-directed RNA polymerase sigma subunit (sigma70/sigma32)